MQLPGTKSRSLSPTRKASRTHDGRSRLQYLKFPLPLFQSLTNSLHSAGVSPPAISLSITQLSALPNEILLIIFTNLNECSSVCLGLACRKMYRLHCLTYNHPVSLFAQSPTLFLYHYLENWMGMRYRWSEIFECFLSREAFGESDREEECGRLVRMRS
jgi:hypothetical protein